MTNFSKKIINLYLKKITKITLGVNKPIKIKPQPIKPTPRDKKKEEFNMFNKKNNPSSVTDGVVKPTTLKRPSTPKPTPKK